MNQLTIIDARKLVDYIADDSNMQLIKPKECSYQNHIGALFTDIILQSGVSYNSVVAPRVKSVLETYPEAYTVDTFFDIIQQNGIERVLKWNHFIKLQRMLDLLAFCRKHNLNYSTEIKNFLLLPEHRVKFLNINGIGNKTLDYLLKLMSIETVAVDRHIFSFIEKAGIDSKDYSFVKTVVEYAADIMEVSRRTIDYSIWIHMSEASRNKQLIFEF